MEEKDGPIQLSVQMCICVEVEDGAVVPGDVSELLAAALGPAWLLTTGPVLNLGLPHCSCSCKNLDSEVALSLSSFVCLLNMKIISSFYLAGLLQERERMKCADKKPYQQLRQAEAHMLCVRRELHHTRKSGVVD